MKNIKDLVKPNAEGWTWPVTDISAWDWLNGEKDIPDWVMSFVPEKEVMIQAGGNCGFYVAPYAQAFDTVHTFEANPVNFRCLVANVPWDNVRFHCAALGPHAGLVELTNCDAHLGGCRIILDGAGSTPMMTIDSFNLPSVDLIHLDTEGSELSILHGAVETITRCRPVIAVEINGLCRDYGYEPEKVIPAIEAFGYHHAGSHRSEHAFIPN